MTRGGGECPLIAATGSEDVYLRTPGLPFGETDPERM
jgi:hypothetical protein